jgi:hypothetical protein
VIIADVEFVPGLAELGADAIHKLFHGEARSGRGFHHLVAVLVGAGLQAGFGAQEPLETGQGVGHHRGISVADMGLGVDVINGSGEVVGHSSGQ